MNGRTRIFEFDGGFLECRAYEDDSEDEPGIYLELFLRDDEGELKRKS
jgi:hypothetical protein